MNIHDGDAELGYWVGEPYWGQGFASEAVDALLGFALTSIELSRIHAHHFARNPASGKVLKNAGLRRIGRHMPGTENNPTTEEVVLYEYLVAGD